MSGLFTHLAERARGETRAVRPRLLARFEPSTPDMAGLTAEAPRSAPVEPAATQPTSAPVEWSIDVDADEPMTAPPEHGALPAPAEATLVEPAIATVIAPAPAEPTHTAPRALDDTPRPALHERAPSSADRHDRVRPSPLLTPQISLQATEATASEPAPAAPERVTAAPVLAQSRRPGPASRREIAPTLAPARAEPPRSKSETIREETTVHVSIGRIELRAAQPPKTPPAKPREPAKPAVMSLDEYLLSRRARR